MVLLDGFFELVLFEVFVAAGFGGLPGELFGGEFEVEEGFFETGHCCCGLGG